MRTQLLRIWSWLPLPEWMRWVIMWALTPKFMVGSVAVIFDEAGQVLLFRHTYRRAYAWGLPGGWMKPGEDAAATIEREVAEEGGLTVRALSPLSVGGNKRLRRVDIVLLCEYVSGEFRPSAEVAEARYFPIAALPGLIEPEHCVVVTQAARARERSRGG